MKLQYFQGPKISLLLFRIFFVNRKPWHLGIWFNYCFFVAGCVWVDIKFTLNLLKLELPPPGKPPTVHPGWFNLF